MSENTTVLVTGTTRGIGKGLAAGYLAQPNTTVIATVRDPHAPAAQALSSLPHGAHSQLIILRLADAGSEAEIAAAVDALQRQHGVRALDAVVANAGVNQSFDPLVAAKIYPDLQRAVEVNAYGPLWLFQRCAPLLLRAAQEGRNPRFCIITSGAGSIAGQARAGNERNTVGFYGGSKALVNYLAKRLSVEVEEVVTWVVNPGMVETDMSAVAKTKLHLPYESLTVEQSAAAIMKVINEATREQTNGRFLNYNGQELPW